jgi:hypothetical protein
VAGKTPKLALKAFTDPIQSALSCFATGRVTVDCYDPADEGRLVFNGGKPTKLHGPERIRITCAMQYKIVATGVAAKPWKVHTTNYIYRLVDRHGSPIVDYHWHPASTPDIPFPHLHARKYGCKLHYITGRVLIEDVLVLASECGASPGDPVKWSRILNRNRKNFALGATWGTSHPGAAEAERAVVT